ncbi:helix-hairpin-helix domain-containing protein [Streptomyces sp. NPDC005931]|uniref:helix-hairpin-helix domain-containing protein n=1 Tax=Streptomyces sp. NPDC005931 TaxID=3364737 RepID=UPI003677E43D
MALRSRSGTATATSGPGRAPASDSRVRHRRPTRSRGRHRDRHASAEELRRRAGVLFGDGGAGGRGDAGRVPGRAANGTTGRAVRAETPAPGGDERAADGESTSEAEELPQPVGATASEGRRGVRLRLALRERLPLWVQARCGLERRSVVALSVVLVAAVGFAVQHFWAGRTQPVREPEVAREAAPFAVPGEGGPGEGESPPLPAAGAVAATGSAAPEIVVDVSGKVRDPGVHRLPAGSRVEDALRAAGGVRPGTRTDGLNRARFLVDGEQVVVGGPAPPTGAGGTPPGGATAAAGTAGAAGPAAPVSLNTATLDQLDTLPGVGPVLARHIVDYRTRHGGFRSVDELREVNGIGDRRFADLRNLVRP